MKPLANDFVTIFKSPDPKTVFPAAPALCVLKNGRYVFCHDIFGALTALSIYETMSKEKINKEDPHIGCVYTSDDKGLTWQRKAEGLKICNGNVFEAGDAVYIMSSSENGLVIYRSNNNAETWDEGHYLTDGADAQSPTVRPWIEDGYINIAVEVRENFPGEIHDGWNLSSTAPVFMRAKISDDLTKRESWTFSNKIRFRDLVKEDELDLYGVPFFTTTLHKHEYDDGRTTDNMSGWLEPNIVRITDEKHYWYDPSGKTFHIIMRAHTSWTGYACIMKAVISEENGKEVITVMPEVNPSGKRVVYIPFPGGQNRFQIAWDEQTKLFWLVSSQPTDSMTKKEFLSPDRFNLPYDERHRLQLCFSKNLVDWCFAGIIAIGGSEKEARNYATIDIDGSDLVLVSRSGSPEAYSAHNTDMLLFHRIKNFRDLVY